MSASRPCVQRTAFGAPVLPDVNRSRYSASRRAAPAPESGTLAGSGAAASTSTRRTSSSGTPWSSPSSSAAPGASVTSRPHSVNRMSRASSAPRRVGLTPTTTSPVSAAAPSQKR